MKTVNAKVIIGEVKTLIFRKSDIRIAACGVITARVFTALWNTKFVSKNNLLLTKIIAEQNEVALTLGYSARAIFSAAIFAATIILLFYILNIL